MGWVFAECAETYWAVGRFIAAAVNSGNLLSDHVPGRFIMRTGSELCISGIDCKCICGKKDGRKARESFELTLFRVVKARVSSSASSDL